jgi:hypothetical protein
MNGDELTDQFVGLAGEERADFESWLAGNFLPPQFKEALAKTQDIIATAGKIVGDVSSVVGIFAALIEVIGLLSGPGRDRLDQLAEEIQHTEQLAYSGLKWNIDAHWADVEALAAPASTLLSEFLAPTVPSAGARPGLLTDSQRAQLETEVLARFRQVLATFLPQAPENIYEIPPYQQVAHEPTTAPDELAALFPEHEYEERINPATFGITDLPDDVRPVEWLGSTPHGSLVWDYRRSLLHIIRTLTQIVTTFKLIDPAFRVTGRYSDEIEKITASLKVLAARWVQCISWTHDLPMSHEYPDSDYPEVQAPAAYESRSMVFVSHWTEHPEVHVFRPVPQEPEFSQRRLEYARKVLAFCGFNSFHEWIHRFEKLATPPPVDESITSRAEIVGVRRLEGMSTYGSHRRTVKRYHVDWDVKYHLGLQPQIQPYDYALGGGQPRLPIEYRFFLESYQRAAVLGDEPQGLIQQRALAKGLNQLVSLRVFSPDILVPTEDDGSFGDSPNRLRLNYKDPAGAASAHASISDLAQGFATDYAAGGAAGDHESISELVQSLAQLGPSRAYTRDPTASDHHTTAAETEAASDDERDSYEVANHELSSLATIGHALVSRDVVAEPPPKAEYLGGHEVEVTIGCSLDFGPTGDIQGGIATFHAWTLNGATANVGALYFAIESRPFRQPAIKTRLFVPLNPTEYWYAAYSRIGPRFVPA